jgi:nitrate/TMAO reductase-like tetraheme cytochrome c subunit
VQNARRIIPALSVALVAFLVVLSCSDDNSNPGSPDVSEGRADSLQNVVDSLLVRSGYAGSDACRQCHPAQYDTFVTSAHAFTMRGVAGEAPGYSHGKKLKWPDSVENWGEIAYVVGGPRNEAMFIDTSGIVVTGKGNNFDISSGSLGSVGDGPIFNDCGKCHATGWSQDTLIEFRTTTIKTMIDSVDTTITRIDTLYDHRNHQIMNGVQCEQCHGPGARHAADSGNARLGNILVDTRSEACLSCHIGEMSLPDIHGPVHDSSVVTITTSTDTLQYTASNYNCISCHSPHSPSQKSAPEGW